MSAVPQPSSSAGVGRMAYPGLMRAMRALAALDGDHARQVNGAGFSKFDVEFGHSLAKQATWTPRQAHAAARMLLRYRRQLERMGIDWETFEEPEPQEQRLERHGPLTAAGDLIPDDHTISWSKDAQQFRVRFAFNRALTEEVKRITGRRWDAGSKAWTFPLVAAEGLHAFANRHRFTLSAGAERVFTEMEHRRAASRATDAEIDIPTLVGELRPFQRAGIAYAVRAKRLFIADEPGLGKSVQALATFEVLDAYPALVVCPATLKLNWRNEVRKFFPHRSVEILSGRQAENPLFANLLQPDISLINYDVLGARGEDLRTRGFKAVAFDECHALKTRKAQRTKAAMALVKDIPVRLMLSGTPLLNKPSELITQLEVVGQLESLGGWHDFNARYAGASGVPVLQELNRRLRAVCFVRRLKRDVLTELPEKQTVTVPLEIDNRREYEFAKAQLIEWIREQARLKEQDPDVAANRARRAETLVRIEKLKYLAAVGKMGYVRQWVAEFVESGRPLVLFAHHRDLQAQLCKEFPDAARIVSDDDITERQRNVDRFQAGDTKLIVCSLKAGGVGITLTAASDVVMLEWGWNQAEMSQAHDRVHRIGQRDSVTVWNLMAEDTIEEWIVQLLASKAQVVDAATEGTPDPVKSPVLGAVIDRLVGA